MSEPFVDQHCVPLRGAPASHDAIAAALAQLPGWRYDAALEAIVRVYRFPNYHGTIAFINALAWIVHREDHHPELVVSYDRCEVRFNTHSVGGVSVNDFICAAKADAVYAQGMSSE